MHFIVSFVLALAAMTVVSLPSLKGRREDRIARRASGPHMLTRQADNSSQSEFPSTQAGAVFNVTANEITSATGSFAVSPLDAVGDGDVFSLGTMVGLDMENCPTGGVAGGIVSTIEHGTETFSAFFATFPGNYVTMMGLSPSAGDVVTISVTATTATSATVVITNESTNQTVSQVVTTGNLCMEEADWLVEDFEVDGSLTTLADFDEIKFTDVSAGTARGSLDISGATILNIEQNGTVLTAVSSSRSTVDIVYV